MLLEDVSLSKLLIKNNVCMHFLLLVCCFVSIEFFPLNSSQFISSHRHIQHLISCCHSKCSHGWFYSNPNTPSCHQVPSCTAVKTWWQLQSWSLAQKGCELRPRFKKELMASLGAGPPGKGAALGTWEEGGRVRFQRTLCENVRERRNQQQTQRDLQRAQERAVWMSLRTKKRDSWKDGDVIAMESDGERDDMGLPFRESQE